MVSATPSQDALSTLTGGASQSGPSFRSLVPSPTTGATDTRPSCGREVPSIGNRLSSAGSFLLKLPAKEGGVSLGFPPVQSHVYSPWLIHGCFGSDGSELTFHLSDLTEKSQLDGFQENADWD